MRPLLVRQLHALLVCDVDPLLEDGAHDAIEGAQVAEARTAASAACIVGTVVRLLLSMRPEEEAEARRQRCQLSGVAMEVIKGVPRCVLKGYRYRSMTCTQYCTGIMYRTPSGEFSSQSKTLQDFQN